MAEHDGAVKAQQTFSFRLTRCRRGDPELLSGAPKKRRVAQRLCRRQKQQPLGVAGQERKSLPKALFESPLKRQRSRKPESACELRRQESSGQLEEGQRVPLCLSHQSRRNSLVEGSRDDSCQELAGVGIG